MANFINPINCNPFFSIVGYNITQGGVVMSLQEYDDTPDFAYLYTANGVFMESRPGVPRDQNFYGNTAFAKVGGDIYGIDGSGSLFDVYKNGVGWRLYTTGGLVNNIDATGGAQPLLWLQSGSYVILKIDVKTGNQLDAFNLSSAGFDIIYQHRGSKPGRMITVNKWTQAPPPDLHWFERANLWDSSGVLITTLDENLYNDGVDEDVLFDDVAINSDRCALVRRNNVTSANIIRIWDLAGAFKTDISYTGGPASLVMSETRIYASDWGTGIVYMWDITDDGVGNKTYTASGSFTTPSPYAAYLTLAV